MTNVVNAVLDVICIASWNADLVSRVVRPIAKGETLMAHSFEIQPGGKGSNAAVAAARQGARVGVVARIGGDDFGRMALALWAKEGIHTQYVDIAQNESSGVAQILVFDDGDNSIAVAVGAGAGLGEANVHGACEAIEACAVVMASNEVPQAATLAAFQLAKKKQRDAAVRNIITLLNPAPAMALPASLLTLCDVLTPNEHEVRILAGLPADASIEFAAQKLLELGAGAVIVTLGGAGCQLFERNGVGGEVTSHHIAGHLIEQVVDTIGAGDAFTGALAAALARGESLIDSARIANSAAALSVSGKGAIEGIPSLKNTLTLVDGIHP
jgi:ribokinase